MNYKFNNEMSITMQATQKNKGVFLSILSLFKFYGLLFIITTALSSCSTITRDEIVDLETGISAWKNHNYKIAIDKLKQYESLNLSSVNQMIAISYLKENQMDSALYWFKKNPESINMYYSLLSQEIQDNSYSDNLSFLEFVYDVANKHNFDPGLLLAFMQQESDFKADAISRTGAVGLMQLMPATAKALGLKVPPENENYKPSISEPHLDERFNPAKNIDSAANHIAFLIRHYQKNKDETNLRKVISAYYAGTGVVKDSIPSYCQYYLKQISKNYQKYRYSKTNHRAASNNFDKINKKTQTFFNKKSNHSDYNKSFKNYIEKSKDEIKKIKDARIRAVYFNNLALINEALNNYNQAENLYKLAILNDDNEVYNFNFGLLLFKQENFEKANEQFAKINSTENLIEVSNLLMSSFYLKTGELDKAFALIWDNKYDYFDAERLNNLGIYYMMKGNIDKAILLFSQSLEKKSSVVTTNNMMASLYYKYYFKESRLDYTAINKSSFLEKSEYIFPLKKINITSHYGWRPDPLKHDWNERLKTMDFHGGLDFAGTKRDTIFSIADGKVISIKTLRGGGKTINIDHTNGTHSVYMHLDKFLIEEGEDVQQGTAIGIVGNTGISTAPHLHLGIYDKKWKSINPLTVLPPLKY